MNAPKKIWVDPENRPLEWWGEEYKEGDDIPYIRADLVDGLVEALEEMTELNRVYWKAIGFEPSVGGTFQEVLDKARAALAKLEEE